MQSSYLDFPYLIGWISSFATKARAATRIISFCFSPFSSPSAASPSLAARGPVSRLTRHNLQYEMKAHSRQALSKVPLSQVRPYVASHLLASNKQTRRYTAYSTCHFD